LCGWRTFIYAEVAASQDYGPINFVSDNDLQMKEWGGGIIEDQRKDKVFKLFYDLNECFDWVLGGGGVSTDQISGEQNGRSKQEVKAIFVQAIKSKDKIFQKK
jgi:hypothetical protein